MVYLTLGATQTFFTAQQPNGEVIKFLPDQVVALPNKSSSITKGILDGILVEVLITDYEDYLTNLQKYSITLDGNIVKIEAPDNSVNLIGNEGINVSIRDGKILFQNGTVKAELLPEEILEINGVAVEPAETDAVALLALINVLQSGGGGTTGIVTITSSGGTTLTSSELLTKGVVHLINYEGTTVSTGFTLSGDTVTFTDGTSLASGTIVKLITE